MSTVTEETALATRTEQSSELAQTAAAMEKQTEIQGAIIIARKFPRSEDMAFAKLTHACKRTSFAEECAYSYPRGGENVEGPSVNLAREAARVWGNIRYGIEIVRDDETTRQIRGWAWDMETNVKITAEDDFAKKVYRKKGGWITADERDLRELTNRRGAILVRNCILQILPKDLIEDALGIAKDTLRSGAEKDPEGERRKVILAFSDLGVTPEMLEQKLGHPLSQSNANEITELRGIYKSIKDGNSTWAEYVATATNGDEPRRKSEATASSEIPTIKTEPSAASTDAVKAFPIDLTKPYHVADVLARAKKGEPFTITFRDSQGVVTQPLTSTDQRLYIAVQSAKQQDKAVIIEAKRNEHGDLTLIGIEEMVG